MLRHIVGGLMLVFVNVANIYFLAHKSGCDINGSACAAFIGALIVMVALAPVSPSMSGIGLILATVASISYISGLPGFESNGPTMARFIYTMVMLSVITWAMILLFNSESRKRAQSKPRIYM